MHERWDGESLTQYEMVLHLIAVTSHREDESHFNRPRPAPAYLYGKWYYFGQVF